MTGSYKSYFNKTFKGLDVLENNKYKYNTRNLESAYQVMSYCQQTMNQPIMYQIQFGINPDDFNKSSFIKTLKRQWLKDWNEYEKIRLEKGYRPRGTPEFHYIYSFEYKEIEKHRTRKRPISYHHCHFYFIVDMKNKAFGGDEFTNRSINALKRIKGVLKGFNPETMQQEDPKINYRLVPDNQFNAKFPIHSLKTEFEDAFVRISYITKDTQKDGVISRSSFDSSIRTVNKEKKANDVAKCNAPF